MLLERVVQLGTSGVRERDDGDGVAGHVEELNRFPQSPTDDLTAALSNSRRRCILTALAQRLKKRGERCFERPLDSASCCGCCSLVRKSLQSASATGRYP